MRRLISILVVLAPALAIAQPDAPAPAPTAPAPTKTPAPAKKRPRKPPKGGAPIDPYKTPVPGSNAPVDPYAPDRGGTPVDPYSDKGEQLPSVRGGAVTTPGRSGLDVTAVQGMLGVQRLDAWLLVDKEGMNPVARALIKPEGKPERAWFFLVPAKGEPALLCHQSDAASFASAPGKKLRYGGYRDLDKSLKALLKGKRSIAMEYAGKAGLPALSRIDAGTLERIRGLGVRIKSSSSLVAFTKSVWGDAGRRAHAVAVHHLTELRKDALGFIARQVTSGLPVTDRDIQLRLLKGMAMRGLVGPAPVVATGMNTADPRYAPSATRSAPIKKGDLVILGLAARLDQDGAIYAETTWVAYVGDLLPERFSKAFDIAVLARDQAIAFVSDRARRHRKVQGFEVDAAARAFVEKAGFGDKFVHRLGHSIDSDLYGGGADLDDLEVKDTRTLVVGSGFTVAPGLYTPNEFGVRTGVCAYFGADGVEVTTPAQEQIETLLRP